MSKVRFLLSAAAAVYMSVMLAFKWQTLDNDIRLIAVCLVVAVVVNLVWIVRKARVKND
jgi:membrane protein DedA with SNARE-associated domain